MQKFLSYYYSILFFEEKDSEFLYDIYEGSTGVALTQGAANINIKDDVTMSGGKVKIE